VFKPISGVGIVTRSFDIAVFAGDGIGPEITEPCIELLKRVTTGFELNFIAAAAGAGTYLEQGSALPEKSLDIARKADAILLSAMGLPSVRYPDGTEIVPQLDLRFELDLYAGVRPVKVFPGMPTPLKHPKAEEIDFVLIRESTEGLFTSHGKGIVMPGQCATETMVMTDKGCRRVSDFSFKLAQTRKERGISKGEVTSVDKANIFKAFAFFRDVFDDVSVDYPNLDKSYAYVDAMALRMVKDPWNLDVLVTENMFGDILSDLGAGLMGGLGMAPSADIGDDHAVFQPCHGSAPDIAGQGKANPTAMFLSAAMMLDWLGEKHSCQETIVGGERLTNAVRDAYGSGNLAPMEFGGTDGTVAITGAIMSALK
jgi:3-isopropylmalate dehydrogenase